jgi:hypothetical protein
MVSFGFPIVGGLRANRRHLGDRGGDCASTVAGRSLTHGSNNFVDGVQVRLG